MLVFRFPDRYHITIWYPSGNQNNYPSKSRSRKPRQKPYGTRLSILAGYLVINSLKLGVVSKAWKKDNIVPIFENSDKVDLSNYRPFSLSSVICKVFKRILKKTIILHLLDNILPGKSCFINLLESQDIVTLAVNQDYPIDVLFTDFSKAFDRVHHEKLILKNEKLILKNVRYKRVHS
ncbi:uncharacterized protein LOC136085182 [Hydra vulgaris]|uniref:uncharacterized protein LOC136085182 n=1 Tax=Hydra vulgaris TaxID=6087 RepID=UPI0032E9CAF2